MVQGEGSEGQRVEGEGIVMHESQPQVICKPRCHKNMPYGQKNWPRNIVTLATNLLTSVEL